jgi:hypothetical protein
MGTPRTPYDAVLDAARDLPRAGSALEAEMVGAALLGSVYAVAGSDRAEAVREFVGGFLAHTSRRRTGAARAVRVVFAALVPDAEGARRVRPGPDPPWAVQVGQVRPVGTWAYGDVYGDQTSYLACFAYDDPDRGGEEHAVVILVDHNLGAVKDLFVGRPADRILDQVRGAAGSDELVWLSEVAPEALRAEVRSYLEITDQLSRLPEDGSLATDWALASARLGTLPATGSAFQAPAPVEPASLVPSFLDSPEARELDRSSDQAAAAVRYAVRLILDFAQDAPDADPLRWSPAVAGLFLLDWVHRRAVLDDDDVAVLPAVVRAWAAWAAARRGLSATAATATDQAIETMTPEFRRLYGTGERRGEAAAAMAQLISDGVDPDDSDALAAWLAARGDPGDPPGPGGGDPTIPHPR